MLQVSSHILSIHVHSILEMDRKMCVSTTCDALLFLNCQSVQLHLAIHLSIGLRLFYETKLNQICTLLRHSDGGWGILMLSCRAKY